MADISKITPPGSQTTYNLKDATAREQVAENKNNILTIYEQNGKTFNLFDFDKWKDCGVDKGSKTVSGNTVTITASADNCYTYFQEVSAPFPVEARIPAAQGDMFVFTWDYTALDNQTNDTVYIFANGSSASGMYVNVSAQSERINFTAPAGTTFITFRLGVGSATKRATYSNIQIQTRTSYDAGFTDYQPYSLPNTKITPELIELVDSGAKNKLKVTKDTIAALNNGTWSGNVFTPAGQTGLTLTINSDGSISTSGAPSVGVYIVLSTSLNTILTVGETYVLSGCTGGSSATYGLYSGTQGEWDNFNGGTEKVYASSITTMYLYVRASTSVAGKIFYPMICTKAAWDVSQKYVPYRPTYEDTVEQVATNKNNISSVRIAVDTLEQYGGGINLLNNTRAVGTTTDTNITVVTNSDKTVTLTRTETASSAAFITITNSQYLEAGTYMLTGCPVGGSGASYEIRFLTPDGQAYIEDKGNGAEFTLSTGGTITACQIRIDKNYNPNNMTFKPMIIRKSDYDRGYRGYQPYAMSNAEITAWILAHS